MRRRASAAGPATARFDLWQSLGMPKIAQTMEDRGLDLFAILPLFTTIALAAWAGAALLGWVP